MFLGCLRFGDFVSVDVVVKRIGEETKDTYSLEEGSRIVDLLYSLNINIETVVVRRNGRIVPEEEELSDNDELVIIPVVSGG